MSISIYKFWSPLKFVKIFGNRDFYMKLSKFEVNILMFNYLIELNIYNTKFIKGN